jgi:hypothetical protein
MIEFNGATNTLNGNEISSQLPSAVPQPPLAGAIAYPDSWESQPDSTVTAKPGSLAGDD